MSAQIRSKLHSKERLQLIERVVRDGATISQACQAFGVSRPTFYKWYSKYNPAASYEENLHNLSDRRRSASEPSNKTSAWVEEETRKLVLSNDSKVSKYVLFEQFLQNFPDSGIGLHGFYNTLVRLHLNTPGLRKRFLTVSQQAHRAWADGFSASERLQAVERVLRGGLSVSSVARELGVSRATLYGWIRRFKGAGVGRRLDELARRKPIREFWPGQATKQQEARVLELVAEHPSASKYVLANMMKERYKTEALGSHGIYNILWRNGLSRSEQRLAWASLRQGYGGQASQVRPAVSWQGRIRQVFEQFLPGRAPAPPPSPSLPAGEAGLWRAGPSFFKQLRRFTPYLLFLFLVTFGLYEWGQLLGSAPSTAQALGWVFASVALSMGTVFFLYSLKYYFTLAVVLSFSREEGEVPKGQGLNGSTISFLGRLFGFTSEVKSADTSEVSPSSGGLEPNLASITLERHPFISVHLPMYNEKRVAERILKACTAFDYSAYEIVVVDDSTDETTEIVRRFAEEHNERLASSGERLGNISRIKVIHRETREGFKGGALKEALKHTDPKAEFIVVFDADFVPYPDTLELFLKYFQVNTGSLDFRKASSVQRLASSSTSEVRGYQDSNIAAIQGYQWHVLNKSENWITRGVRSEYAGSYVIERSGEELYGGLKQIAGSVYMIRRDLLDRFGWGTSLTEDFELTLKLYEAGYKVVYTPYIQAPAECASTLRRLIRQRMRWAEGHSFNIKKYFWRILFGASSVEHRASRKEEKDTTLNPNRSTLNAQLSLAERLEFLYLSPYYLQAAFFLLGTMSWLVTETVFRTSLPFWTAVWGWSLVLTNLLSLPLMNAVGLFLEEAEEKDFAGVLSFIVLSYILVPFQAYASVKGFLEKEEGPWFRTPKTGRITDVLTRGRFYRFISGIFPQRSPAVAQANILSPALAFVSANRTFSGFTIRKRQARWIGKTLLVLFLLLSVTLVNLAGMIVVGSRLPGAGGAFAIGSQEIEAQGGEDRDGSRSEEDGTSKIILTDNREVGLVGGEEEVIPSSVEPLITVERHTPQTHPEEFYLKDGNGEFVPYILEKEKESVSIRTKSAHGIQKIVFETTSVDIKLYEKVSGNADFVLRAVSSPAFEYLDEQNEWKEYIPLVPGKLRIEEREGFAIVELRVDLLASEDGYRVLASVLLAIGRDGENPISKFTFRLEENSNLNRLRWKTRLTGSDPVNYIARDVYDLREGEADRELEEQASASLLGAPATQQQFGDVEIGWEDFITNEESLRLSSGEVGMRNQELENTVVLSNQSLSKSDTYMLNDILCFLFPYCAMWGAYRLGYLTFDGNVQQNRLTGSDPVSHQLSAFGLQNSIRVEQSTSEQTNTVYFYPDGKRGALTIDPTLSLTTSSSTVQVDVPNRYRTIIETGDTGSLNEAIKIYDRFEDDASPDLVYTAPGAKIKDNGTTTYSLTEDDERRTDILENTSTRVRVAVTGKFSTSAGSTYLFDDGGDDALTVQWLLTFTTEGLFSEAVVDFKDGYTLTDAAPVDGFATAGGNFNVSVVSHSETILFGDGETESSLSVDGSFSDLTTYVVFQGTGSYQDMMVGTFGPSWESNFGGTHDWGMDVDFLGGIEEDDAVSRQVKGVTLSGQHRTYMMLLLQEQADLDTEAEREGFINDFRNPDVLTYTTGSEWDDAPATPGLDFDGSGDYVNMGDPADGSLDFGSSTDFTIEAWVKTTDTGTQIVGKYFDGITGAGWNMQIGNTGKLYAQTQDGTNFVASTDDAAVINDGAWHHVTVVNDRDGSMTRYVDGVQSGTADSITSVGSVDNSYNLYVGRRN
ncbi:glycosyltransferase, partial [Patescibacteria group bacterium]|nr:glycosyltransferase [Patescibacteria group bacterium]